MEAIIYKFYQFLKEGKIMARRCRCGEVSFPPRGLCPSCGSDVAEWVELVGEGKLLFASAGANQFWSATDPFILATVQLDEGPIVAAPLYDDSFDYSKPEEIWNYNLEEGIRVKVVVSKNPIGGEMVAFSRTT